MKNIYVFGGLTALVDDDDYEMAIQFKWRNHRGYAITSKRIGVNKKITILMHRMVMQKFDLSGLAIDHINGQKMDNRKENLRVCTFSQNLMNRGKPITNKSGYKGVSWNSHAKKWQASIGYSSGKHKFLGGFDNKMDAYIAYCNAAYELHGDFANVGLSKC